MARHLLDVAQAMDRARRGEARSIARLITAVEDRTEQLPEILATRPRPGHRAHVVGITGSPGVGKSTTTDALIRALRGQGRRVGVLAVDPSSPFSGGALLGDRVRMQDHADDPGVYIRSMAGRGHLGGLALAAPQAVRVLELVGFDVVLVETVGVGQNEVDIVEKADTVLVLLAPGMGDGIQAAKAGILEIGDVFVVNKADRDGADATVRELRGMLGLGAPREWVPPIVKTMAHEGAGIADLLAAVEAHQRWAHESGAFDMRRRVRARGEIESIAWDVALSRLRERDDDTLETLADDVAQGRRDPFTAAVRWLDSSL